MSAQVYRCFDAAGDLLYVGCTTLPVKERLRLHTSKLRRQHRDVWTRRVASVEVEECGSLEEARQLEERVIRTESPTENRLWNPLWHREQFKKSEVKYIKRRAALEARGYAYVAEMIKKGLL